MEDSVYKLQAFTMEPVVKPIHLTDAVETWERELRQKDQAIAALQEEVHGLRAELARQEKAIKGLVRRTSMLAVRLPPGLRAPGSSPYNAA